MYYMAKKFICVQSEFKRRAMAAMAGYVCYEGEKNILHRGKCSGITQIAPAICRN